MLATIQQCNVANSVTDKVPIKPGDKSIQSVKVMVHRFSIGINICHVIWFYHWMNYIADTKELVMCHNQNDCTAVIHVPVKT